MLSSGVHTLHSPELFLDQLVVRTLMRDRIDLSEWVLHFIHDRTQKTCLPGVSEKEYERRQNAFDDEDWNGRPDELILEFDTEYRPYYSDYDLGRLELLTAEVSAHNVLQTIIEDGYIRASWAIRSGRPTIYGQRAAVCFTEMPLYALSKYIEARQTGNFVGRYAIALKKSEFFEMGARPVIYGTSGRHCESAHRRTPLGLPRILDSECGIGLNEQYRYVYMKLGSEQPIDWSHEREWRWTTCFSRALYPGLPIWAKEYDEKKGRRRFSEVLILTAKKAEVDWFLRVLQTLYDAGLNDFATPFDLTLLANTRVTSFEQVRELGRRYTRVEDLPVSSLSDLSPVEVTEQALAVARRAFEMTKAKGSLAAKCFKKKMQRDAEGRIVGPYGYAWVVTYDSRSEPVQALVRLKLAKPIGGSGYHLNIRYDEPTESSIDIEKAAAAGAAKVLEAELGCKFYVQSRLD